MGRRIFRSGNSTVVSLPPEVLERLGLEPGDEVTVVADPERGRIVVTPTGTARSRDSLEIRERLSELIERYAPALERLAELEERERAAAAGGVDADALERARGLRDAFAARHGVLSIDLVEAARKDREAGLGASLREEDQDRESRG